MRVGAPATSRAVVSPTSVNSRLTDSHNPTKISQSTTSPRIETIFSYREVVLYPGKNISRLILLTILIRLSGLRSLITRRRIIVLGSRRFVRLIEESVSLVIRARLYGFSSGYFVRTGNSSDTRGRVRHPSSSSLFPTPVPVVTTSGISRLNVSLVPHLATAAICGGLMYPLGS